MGGFMAAVGRGVGPENPARTRSGERLPPISRPDYGRGDMNPFQQRPSGRPGRIRLFMPLRDADELAHRLAAEALTPQVQRLLDQLWLRSVLIEQWRRTGLSERGEFHRRADRILGALDP